MLFYVLFACFLAMTTTEAQTLSSTVHQEATTQQHSETPDITYQVPMDAIDPVMPAALEAAPTIIAPTTTFFGDKTPIPQAEATKENIKAGSPSQSTLIRTNGSTVSANKEMPMSTAQNGEIASTTVSSMQVTTANTILNPIQTSKSRTPTESAVMTSLNTTFKFIGSIQTSNSQTQTESEVMTDRPLSLTTQVVPTVKLSAITTSTSEKLTTKLEKTTRFVRQSTKATTKLAKTSKAAALVTPLSNDDRENSVKHGKIVAGIIGGALIAMFIGFLVILYKKHTLKKHQIATTDWAGPTPFLETGGDSNGHVTLRSASRISLTGFLPQRLSKRLTLLAESGEEMQDMQDMTIPTTFVGKEEQKVEKNGTKADTISKSDKEAVANKSDMPTKAENVVVVDEMNRNGEINNKEGDIGQAKTERENGAENAPTQPPAAEDPPKESNN